MGWLFYARDKAEIVKELASDGETCKCLRYTVRGNVFYGVYEVVKPGEPVARFIGVHLLSKSDGRWGYKAMDESMQPYYYDCPLEYLIYSTQEDAGSKAWREKVKEHHAAKKVKRSIRCGDIVRLTDGCTIRGEKVTELQITLKDGAKLYGNYRGMTIKVNPRHIAGVVKRFA